MINIRVTTFRQAAAPPLAAAFDKAGGTIGRAPDNLLVLADGEQSISRVQARIVWREGRFWLSDQGGNPSLLNGQPLASGHEVPIGPGDELQMGEYGLRVEAADPAPPASPAGGIPLDWDPFEDMDEVPLHPAQPAASVPLSPPPRLPTPPPAPVALPPSPAAALPPAAASPPTPTPRRAGEPAAPPDAMLSWNEPSGESRTVIRSPSRPKPARATFASAPFAGAAGPPAWQPPPGTTRPSQTVPPPVAKAPATQVADGAAPSADMAALASALREGLGLRELPANAQPLTPATMRTLGAIVQEATRGTIELLVARAALKREIRAEVTVIAARENNPLKFSPSAEVALGHLLGPASRGFMEPQRAMRDAYDDLRAHQFGFLAGMRAALEGILKRFDPAELEAKLTQKKSILSALLPNKKKAQMWEVFTELYGQISSEASDDFHRLFGEEFLRAYNEYVDQLEGHRP